MWFGSEKSTDLIGPGRGFRPNPAHLDRSPPPTAPSSMIPLLGFLGEINGGGGGLWKEEEECGGGVRFDGCN